MFLSPGRADQLRVCRNLLAGSGSRLGRTDDEAVLDDKVLRREVVAVDIRDRTGIAGSIRNNVREGCLYIHGHKHSRYDELERVLDELLLLRSQVGVLLDGLQ